MRDITNNAKLAKTTIIYFIGNFSSRILSFLLVPLYTSILSVSSYGTIDLVMTANQILAPVLSLQIMQGMFRFLVDCKEEIDRKRIISSSFLILCLGCGFLLATVLPYGLITGRIEWILACPYIVLGMINNYVILATRGLKKNKLYAASNVITSLLQVLSNIVFILGLRLGSISLLLSPIMTNLLSIVILLTNRRMYKYFVFCEINKKTAVEILRFSIPTVPNTIIWWGMSGFSKVYLSSICGEASLGLFSIANKFGDIVIAIFTIFNLAWAEVAYETYGNDNRDEYYNSVYKNLIRFIGSLVIIAAPVTWIISPYMIKGEFISARGYIPILYIISFYNIIGSFLTTIFSAFKDPKYIVLSALPATVINVVLNLVLVKRYQIWGTVSALLISMFVFYLCNLFFANKFLNIHAGSIERACMCGIVVSCGLSFIENVYIQVALLFCALVVFVVLNKKMLRSVIGVACRKTGFMHHI